MCGDEKWQPEGYHFFLLPEPARRRNAEIEFDTRDIWQSRPTE
jgi:hypothetical protein